MSEKQDKQKAEKIKLFNMLKRVFNGKDGKELDKFLRDVTGYEYDQYSDNPERMAYLLGRRSVYISLQKFLKEANDGRRDTGAT